MQTSHDVLLRSMLSLGCRHLTARTLCSPEWNDTQLIQQVGTLIRHLRHAAGLSQEGFAARCGLHRTYIGAIERGEKAITITTANKLAQALGMSLAQLFTQLETESDIRDDNRCEREPDVRQCCRSIAIDPQAQWRFLAVLGRPNHFESGQLIHQLRTPAPHLSVDRLSAQSGVRECRYLPARTALRLTHRCMG